MNKSDKILPKEVVDHLDPQSPQYQQDMTTDVLLAYSGFLDSDEEPEFDDVRKADWLKVYADTASDTSACTAVCISYNTYLDALENDKRFEGAVKQVRKLAIEMLEVEARRRAYHGIRKPIYCQGVIVGHETQYSDKMLELLLKAEKPDKYRERKETSNSNEISIYLDSDDLDL